MTFVNLSDQFDVTWELILTPVLETFVCVHIVAENKCWVQEKNFITCFPISNVVVQPLEHQRNGGKDVVMMNKEVI